MDSSYRVLVVAPTTDLTDASSEAAALVNLLHANLLQGNVTVLDVLDTLRDGTWDIIWFATHGDETGIVLSDGHLSASILTTLVRTSGAWLVVLNTCYSLNVAFRLHSELGTDLICTVKAVPDRDAFLTATQFAIQLNRGLSTHDAYLAAKPGQNENYLYLVGNKSQRASRVSTVNEPLDAQADKELERMIALIDGDPRWGPGLRSMMATLEEKVEELSQYVESRLRQLERAMSSLTISTILLAILSFALLIAVWALVFSQ